MENYYQLKGGKLKVKVISVQAWDVKVIREDNGLEDSFPIMYFKDKFKKL